MTPVFLARAASVLLLTACTLPVLFLAYEAFAPGTTSDLARMFDTVLPTYFGNTLVLTALATLLATFIGAGCAVTVVYFKFPARRFLEVALALPLVLPPYLVAIVLREISHREAWPLSFENLYGAAAALAISLYPYSYLLLKFTLQTQSARFLEIGKATGLNRSKIFRRALLPLALPALFLGALLIALETMSDYGTVGVLGVVTLTSAVHRAWFDLFNPGLAAQIGLLSLVMPTLFLFLYVWLTRGRSFSNSANRPNPPQPMTLSRGSAMFVLIGCAIPPIVGFVLPVGVLIDWAVPVFPTMQLSSLYGDVLRTLTLSVLAVIVCLCLALMLALVARSTTGRAWNWSTFALTSFNYAIPVMVLAIAMLALTSARTGFVDSVWVSNTILVLLSAVVLRYLIFAYFSIEVGLSGVSVRTDEMVRSSRGSRRLQVPLVLATLIRGNIVLGAMLVFINVSKDLTLSTVLQPFGYSSLALQVYNHASVDLYGQSAVYGLCMVLVGIYPVLAIGRWFRAR